MPHVIRDFRRDVNHYELTLSCDEPTQPSDYITVTGWYASHQLAVADARAMMDRDPVLRNMTKIVSVRRLR